MFGRAVVPSGTPVHTTASPANGALKEANCGLRGDRSRQQFHVSRVDARRGPPKAVVATHSWGVRAPFLTSPPPPPLTRRHFLSRREMEGRRRAALLMRACRRAPRRA